MAATWLRFMSARICANALATSGLSRSTPIRSGGREPADSRYKLESIRRERFSRDHPRLQQYYGAFSTRFEPRFVLTRLHARLRHARPQAPSCQGEPFA